MSLKAEERASIIAKAMEWNFGDLLLWERPVMAHTFGDNDLRQVDLFETILLRTRAEALTAFEQMSDEDLCQIRTELSDDFRISVHNKAAMTGLRIDRLHGLRPSPIVYGFGHPALAARFEHWTRMPKLSLHEVSLLSLGADPSCMKVDIVVDLTKTRASGKLLWSAQTSFLDRREIFRRCYHFTGFGHAAEPIASIKRWIDDLDINVHPEFYEGLEKRTRAREVQTLAPSYSSKPMINQERETLLKLIAAMAVGGYAFKAGAQRNQATADIQSDLDRLGIPLDQKTILKWVREACEIIPNVD